MNAIILTYNKLVNGIVIDALEHYVYLRTMGKRVKFIVLVPSNKCNDVEVVFRQLVVSRYGVAPEIISDMIIVRNKMSLGDIKLKNVLLFGSQDVLLYPYIRADKFLIVKEHTPTKHWYKLSEKYYEALAGNSNVLLFREYDYNVVSSFDIVCKSLFAFDIYKPCSDVMRETFMISLSSKGSLEDLHKTVDREDCLKLVSYGIDMGFKHPKYNHLGERMNDIFSLFGTYVYGNSGKFGDPRPRLFIECKYYNKDVIMLGDTNGDGAEKRYNEFLTNTRREVIDSRNMTLDKPLIKEFLN